MAEAGWGGIRFCGCCARLFDPEKDLRDDESRRVCAVCGICQSCQDVVYGQDGGQATAVHRSGRPVLMTKTLH